MIPNNRKPFPFSRLLSRETPDVAARKELEEVVKWFQEELERLRDAINTTDAESDTLNQETIDAVYQQILILQQSIAALAGTPFGLSLLQLLNAQELRVAAELETLDQVPQPILPVEFAQQQALQFVVENRTTDPLTPVTGQIWVIVP